MVLSTRGKSVLLVVVAGVVALSLLELACRLLIVDDERGYGALMGIVLPPYRIVTPDDAGATDRTSSYRGIVVDGREITVGDMSGYHRFDPVLGYTHLANATSANGWWQSNNIGARNGEATLHEGTPGKKRWFLLGESFAHGSGLPTEQTWAHLLEKKGPSTEIVNLAVDGYSMAQAYLRYRSLAAQFAHDGVMLMFVPDVDLWREVNTLRTLGEPWKVQAVMPRFVVDGESIRLVPSPYREAGELLRDNRQGLSETLREHLRRYDRFYFPFEHASVPVIGHFITFKVAVAAYGRYARGAMRRKLREPGSEAMQVSRGIFGELYRNAADHGRPFVVLVLPTAYDLHRLREEADYSMRWARLVESACAGPWRCVDLSQPLRSLAREEIDTGPDGNHYGPNVNRHIAAAVRAAIAE